MEYAHQAVVVGGGLAGLRAAIEAHDRGLKDVAVLSMVYPVRSHSGAAQGGINAALGNAEGGRDDTWERHAFDTVKGSDYLADQDAVAVMTREAPECVIEMEHWGCPFSRTEEGKIAQRPFGGAGFPRTCYAADRTGHTLLHTMYEQVVRRGIRVYPERFVLSLAQEDGRCTGLIALNLTEGKVESFRANAVIFATGGAGRIYARSTNAIISTGHALAVAYRAGVPLEDMEFVQFHPTTLYGTNILMSEGARGEGAYLLNNAGERFMRHYAEKAMELAPRDIVARSIQTEINEGRGFEGEYVHLDLRHLGKERILERLPGIRDIAIQFAGVDPVESPVPIQPGQHYSMGGISCTVDGETTLPGFYAAGECACVSVHGANRLGGNSLLETIVFGRRAGEAAARALLEYPRALDESPALGREMEAAEQEIRRMLAPEGCEVAAEIRDELTRTMSEKVGVFREGTAMQEAIDRVRELQEHYSQAHVCYEGRRFNIELLRGLELGGMLEVAEIIAMGAERRQESRGGHFRTDYPERDDARWLRHTLAYRSDNGPILRDKEVTITMFQPEARKY